MGYETQLTLKTRQESIYQGWPAKPPHQTVVPTAERSGQEMAGLRLSSSFVVLPNLTAAPFALTAAVTGSLKRFS
jgi:hypothetical protein